MFYFFEDIKLQEKLIFSFFYFLIFIVFAKNFFEYYFFELCKSKFYTKEIIKSVKNKEYNWNIQIGQNIFRTKSQENSK